MKAGKIGLLESDEEFPGKELSSVRVARDLEIEADPRRGKNTAGLVGQKHLDVTRRGPGQGVLRAGRMAPEKPSPIRIGYPRQKDPASAVLQDSMIIEQDRESDSIHLFHPGLCA